MKLYTYKRSASNFKVADPPFCVDFIIHIQIHPNLLEAFNLQYTNSN